MNAGRPPGGGVVVAVDVHYLPAGGARAAAVVAADVTFGDLLADRTAHVPEVRPYRPGQFYLRELPPLHVVLDGVQHMRLLVVDGYADLDPAGPAWVPTPTLSSASRSSAWPRPRSAPPPTPCQCYAGVTPAARCMSQPPGCPATTPRTWSATWQATTGCPMPYAAPTPSHAATHHNHDALCAKRSSRQ